MTTLGALRASARGIGYLVRRGDVSGGEWLVGKGLNEKSVLGYPTVGRELSPCVDRVEVNPGRTFHAITPHAR